MYRNLTKAFLVSLIASHGIAFQPVPRRRLLNSRAEALFAKKKTKKVQKEKANHDKKWQPYFERLVEYNRINGNFDVTNDEELGMWLQDQREQHQGLQIGRKVRLTRKRAVALEQIGAVSDNDQF